MPEGAGAGVGAGGASGAEVGGAEEEGAEVSDGSRALALRVHGNVIVGSSGFQQFFLMYAKLMAGLRDSKSRRSKNLEQLPGRCIRQ